ncbi:MAG: hypothetical protein K2I81_04355 [Alphaproteobacteria bacterium]|nr:hypothetical protein [Alphaproteobacteria bacterium]
MKLRRTIFNTPPEAGGMLVELMLSIALAMVVIPFIFRYQQRAVRRAENIAVARQMEGVQNALERYIVAHRDELLAPVGKNITRLALSDLVSFGVSEDLVADAGDKYQLRVLKSADLNNQATLQGVVVFNDGDISPMRTREIVNIAGDRVGFLDSGRAYGAFGAWSSAGLDLGLPDAGGIVETTTALRDNAKYLWRVPSADSSDATMLSALSLGGHDIKSVSFFNSRSARFDELLSVGELAAGDLIFQNRTSIDKKLSSVSATVAGALSSDSKNMEVVGKFALSDLGKFTNFSVADMYVTNMTLAGLSISGIGGVSMLKVNQALDMTSGRIDAMFVTVGFAGSITPRLVVRYRIEDSINSAYYWDASNGVANLSDVSFAELARMAPMALAREGAGTSAARIFGAVAANKNATASDYMNAITEIQKEVRKKYSGLNLQ